jgi:hypothetical protein
MCVYAPYAYLVPAEAKKKKKALGPLELKL